MTQRNVQFGDVQSGDVQSRDVRFGNDLLRPELCSLVSAFRKLALDTLDSPLYVDTIFAVDRAIDRVRAESTPFSGSFWCVLLDIHRLFLFQASGEPGAARINSVGRLVMDDHVSRGDRKLSEAMKEPGYRFLYAPETLDVLPMLWRSPTTLIFILDLSTGEIDSVPGSEYPPTPSCYSGNPLDALSVSPLELDDGDAGSNWRCIAPDCRLEGLTSRYTGIIRNEYVRFTSTSIPCATTRMLWSLGKEEALCGGLSTYANEALAVGRCEAMERFQVAFIPETEQLVHARFTELQGSAVNPRALFFPSGLDQTAAVDSPMYWTTATRIARSELAFVPAQEVWFGTLRLPRETVCIRPTTNGCAAGNNVSEAALFAIMELVERDAYLVTWYLRQARGKLDLDSVKWEPVQLLLARIRYRFPGYRIHVFDIGTEVPIPAVAAIAVRDQGTGPKTLHAAAARPVVEQAVFSALKDLALSFDAVGGLQERRPDWKPPESEETINSPDDHRSFYASDDRFSRLSFLDFDSRGDVTAQAIDQASVFHRLKGMKLRAAVLEIAETLELLGLPVFLKDITHGFSARRGLYCVKAVIPGLFPMWYGRRHIRFSLTERLRRLAAERTGRPAISKSDINLAVHPFG